MVGIGFVAAASLLIYLPIIHRDSEYLSFVRAPFFDAATIWNGLGNALAARSSAESEGANGPQIWIWIALLFVGAVAYPFLPVRAFLKDRYDSRAYIGQVRMPLTKTFWSPLQSKQILVATESTENHRLFDRMGLRTFYIPDVGSQQELTDLVNVLRTVFELKFVTSNMQSSTITVRASQNVLGPTSRFLEALGSGHPEVMLDVRIYQISRTVVNNFGLQIPNQFNLYNIPVAALGLTLGGVNIQDLINQLIANGGINQADSTAISALLAQLPSNVSSIFKQPLATFGGGLTLMGVSLGTLGATLSKSDSQVQTLQHVTLRAEQGKDATMNLGSRYPIINASFAPIFNTSAISQAIQNNSFIAPVPSFTYEDIGINLKVKPVVHAETDVSLTVELKVRALTGASANGVPVIGNREYSGSINLKNEQSAVVAGQITQSEQRSLSGIPGLGQVPVVGRTADSNTTQKDSNELLVVITPHIISLAEAPESEIWMTGVK